MTSILPEPKTLGHVTFKNPQVNLYVKDAEKSAKFYSSLFGFKESFRTPRTGTPIHIELRLGNLILGVASHESVRRIHGLSPGSGPVRGEVALWTDNVDEAFADLKARGARPLSVPHNFGSLCAAWVADPDGNPIQIVARISKKPHEVR